MSLLVIVLVAVCGGIAERARAQGGGASDRAVLVALYEATGGPQWNARRNWASGRPLERWRGVSTKRGGRVRELDLAGAGLSGELPAALGRLTELKRLDLSGNALSGEVPESMLQMTSLETLALLPQAGSGLCARSEALQAWLESLGAGLPACPGSGATGEIEGTEAGRAVVEAVRIASEAVGEVIAGIAETVAGVVGVAVAPTELRIAEGGSGSYTVALTAKPSEEVEVEVVGAAGDVSVDRATLRFAGGNWDAAQRVTVRAARDADALADEPVTLAHRVRGGGYEDVTAPSVTVVVTETDEAPELVSATVEGAALTLTYGEDLDASSVPSPGDFSLSVEESVAGRAAVRRVAGIAILGQKVTLTLDAPVSVGHAVMLSYTPLSRRLRSAAGTYANAFADWPVVNVTLPTLSIADSSGGEGDGSIAFTVTLEQRNERQVTVGYATADATAKAGLDYAGASGTLTFAAGETEKTLRVEVTDDRLDEGDETFDVLLRAAANARVAPAAGSATGTIRDDDTAGVTVSPQTLSMRESSNGSYTVVLASRPHGTVTVRVAVTGDPDVTASPESLTFEPDIWNAAQTVTVSAAADRDTAHDEATVRHTVEGGGYDAVAAVQVSVEVQDNGTGRPPNVLFIAVDDLNDWIEPLGGHPQAKTPNLARLAKRSTLFTRAYAAAPLCNPSRIALLTGIAPYRTGIYTNAPQRFRRRLSRHVTLPQAFRNAGYWAGGSGKIHHERVDRGSWNDYFPSMSNPRPGGLIPPLRHVWKDGLELYSGSDQVRLRWGPMAGDVAKMSDAKVVEWVSAKLGEPHANKPFFLACGIFLPHAPWYLPKQYFDRFPLGSIELPRVLSEDLADVPKAGVDLATKYGLHAEIVRRGKWRGMVQAYLASISFADDMVGRVLDALDQSEHADNTMVVLWSDHGWHLGEKRHWRKQALWEEATRVPLMISAPRGTPGLPAGTRAGAVSARPVSLLDLYPTLLDLAGLPTREGLDGRSLVPLLRDPTRSWPAAVMTQGWMNHAVRSDSFRYIRYADGSEEFYDHRSDPLEWTNLASDQNYAEQKKKLARLLPQTNVPQRRGVLVSPPDLKIAEGSSAGYSVALTSRPTGPVTVTMTTDLATTDLSVTPHPLALQFTPKSWSAPQWVTVRAARDADTLTDPAVRLAHSASGADYGSVTVPDVAVTVAETGPERAVGATSVGAATLGPARAVGRATDGRDLGLPAGSPNVVLIYTDDQGYGDVSALNPEAQFRTPHLDRLVREGMTFTDAHAAAATCTPSRYGLLTGRYAWRTRLKRGDMGAEGAALIADGRTTLASLLRAVGYRTAMIGKWHLGMSFGGRPGARNWSRPIRGGPLEAGFDYFFGLPASLQDGPLGYVENRRFLAPPQVRTKQKPSGVALADDRIVTPSSFARVGLGRTESPSFDDQTVLEVLTDRAVAWIDGHVAEQGPAEFAGPAVGWRGKAPFFLYVAYPSPHRPGTPAEQFRGRSAAGAYGDFVIETDARVGQLLDALDRNGLFLNTLVLFTSDNGPETTQLARLRRYGHASAGGLRGGRGGLYEGGHRVPFIVRWPTGVQGGASSAAPLSQTDVLATFAAILERDLSSGEGEDSTSFLSLLRGAAGDHARPPLVHHSSSGHFAVRAGRWKLHMIRGSGGSLEPRFVDPGPGESAFELYDLEADPGESRDLAASRPEVVARLKSALTRIVQRGRSGEGPAVGNDGPAWWPELTWVDGPTDAR